MPIFHQLDGVQTPIKLWTPLDSVEEQARAQLMNIATLPWIAHLAVMPDVHYGIGATVGSVIGMRGAVCPAAVGVDIGCGMGALKTDIRVDQLPDNLSAIRAEIEKAIPVGYNQHLRSETDHNSPDGFWSQFEQLAPEVQDLKQKALLQCGTLGGGNHFIELCIDSGKCSACNNLGSLYGKFECRACDGFGKVAPSVWMMLHSGSRNIGNVLANVHMAKAKTLKHNEALSDLDLASFLADTPEMQAYRRDLYWAQQYALLNRLVMFKLYTQALKKFFPDFTTSLQVMCHHNYVAEETHFGESLFVTRKGAISAQPGQLGIIPGSMGTRSFIVKGLGNPESLCSASHGAGRRMSRGEARRRFTADDLKEQTRGVECRKDVGVVDEIPQAYKDIEQVMANQSDLVSIVAELSQVLCVKG